MKPRDSVNVPEAAKLLGRSPATVRGWIKQGLLKSVGSMPAVRNPNRGLTHFVRLSDARKLDAEQQRHKNRGPIRPARPRPVLTPPLPPSNGPAPEMPKLPVPFGPFQAFGRALDDEAVSRDRLMVQLASDVNEIRELLKRLVEAWKA